MTIRQNAVLVVWISMLSACAGDAASAYEGELDGAVRDGGLGDAGQPEYIAAAGAAADGLPERFEEGASSTASGVAAAVVFEAQGAWAGVQEEAELEAAIAI